MNVSKSFDEGFNLFLKEEVFESYAEPEEELKKIKRTVQHCFDQQKVEYIDEVLDFWAIRLLVLFSYMNYSNFEIKYSDPSETREVEIKIFLDYGS